MLNRDGISQAKDGDPKYNRSGSVTGADICWNIQNHLDEGVLSYNYDGMLDKDPDKPTIWEHMWPITVIELGDGFVIGREKVVTKASGTFAAPKASNSHTVHLYEQCLLVGTATERQPSGGIRVTVGQVVVALRPGQQAVIVWGV
jgi:hypothetical protein